MLIDRELEEELLLWDEDGELEEELVDRGMQEEEELLLLLDISLQHALLDEQEHEIAADQQLHEQLLDFEFFDELQLEDAHE